MAKKQTKPTTSIGAAETIDVVYKCGHSGQRREVIYPHIGTWHILEWIKGNVGCGKCSKAKLY